MSMGVVDLTKYFFSDSKLFIFPHCAKNEKFTLTEKNFMKSTF